MKTLAVLTVLGAAAVCSAWVFPGEDAGDDARFCPNLRGDEMTSSCTGDDDCRKEKKCCKTCYGAEVCMHSCKNRPCLYEVVCEYGFKENRRGCPDQNCACFEPDKTVPCDEGTGNQVIMAYCYDQALGRCRTLDYKGCGGNANIFDSPVDCREFCETSD